jgi:formiminotetrahydrofolate cyclodeaminase
MILCHPWLGKFIHNRARIQFRLLTFNFGSSARTTTTTQPRLIMTDSSKTDKLMAQYSIDEFCTILSSKQPTPGGGASAAISAAIGASTASMSAAYTQRKKDQESGAAELALQLIATLDLSPLFQLADDDVQAYKDLQSTWSKDCTLSSDEISEIQARALRVPTTLLEACHARIVAIQTFLPHCNPNITSDAKVGIHQLAGAARAAYQTVMVNTPLAPEKRRLVKLLLEIQQIESDLLKLE